MSEQPITVEVEFTPGILRGLRRRGFLTSETPDGIAAAVFGVLAQAFEDSEFRARPEPAPAPAASPLEPTASPSSPLATAPPAAPPRRKSTKASPPAAGVEELRDGDDIPEAQSVRRPSANVTEAAARRAVVESPEDDPDAQRRRVLEKMSRATAVDPRERGC
jgi:hypothetical protein